MKVLHTITGLNTGGAETVLCRLLEALHPPDFKHTVVSLASEGELDSRVRAAGATLMHLAMQRARPDPRAWWRLRGTVHAVQPDVVHGWMYHANLMATLAAWGTGVPVLWGIRQSLYQLHREKIGTRMVIRGCRTLSGLPARIVYNSATSAAQHETFGFHASRRVIIPNGFDTELFHADVDGRARIRAELDIAPDAEAIGLVARWHPMKDQSNFLHAAALYSRFHPTAVYVLSGAGLNEGNTELMALVRSLGLRQRVRLCGRRDDMPALNAALDIASSSSWGEAFPNVIGEAMACEVPCVATDVGDVREIMGDTGIVVPARDPQALCHGWEELAALSISDRRALGKRARQRILQRYSLGSMASQYANLYAEVTGEH